MKQVERMSAMEGSRAAKTDGRALKVRTRADCLSKRVSCLGPSMLTRPQRLGISHTPDAVNPRSAADAENFL